MVRSRSGGLLGYVVFVGLNIWGVEVTFRFTVLITLLALAALVVLWVGAIPHFDFANLVDIAPERGQFALAAQGRRGHPVRASIRDLVLSRDRAAPARRRGVAPARPATCQGASCSASLTLIVCAFLTLFLNVGIAPGADALATSGEPVLEGYRTIFGEGVGAKVLGLVAVAGLIASFHTIIFAYGRNIYSLSRAGLLPALALDHPRHPQDAARAR